MSRQLRPSPACLNCAAPVATRFCSECGQENTDYRVSLARLLGDLFEELFQLESRLWRTLWTLFRRPGLLTREYNAGRRVRYTTPLRLYLIASFAYFFVDAIVPPRLDEARLVGENRAEQAELQKLPPPKSWLDRKVRQRLGIDESGEHVNFNEVSRRARTALNTNIPKVMAVLVPLFALLLLICFRGRYYVEHLVFGLHVHATGFLLLTLALPTHVQSASGLAYLAAFIWFVMALRVVYEQSWLRVAAKAVLIFVIYAALLGAGVLVALLIGAGN